MPIPNIDILTKIINMFRFKILFTIKSIILMIFCILPLLANATSIKQNRQQKHILFPIQDQITTASFSSDSKTILFGTTNMSVYLLKFIKGSWHVINLPCPNGICPPANDVTATTAISGNGKVLVVGSSSIGLYMFKNGKWSIFRPDPVSGDGQITGISLSADGHTMLISSYENGAFYFTDNKWHELTNIGAGKDAGITATALSADGSTAFVAIYQNKNYIRIHDLWQQIKLPNNGIIISAAFSPKGKLLLLGTQHQGAFIYKQTKPNKLKHIAISKNYSVGNLFISNNKKNMLFGTSKHGTYLYNNGQWRRVTKTVKNKAVFSPRTNLLVISPKHNQQISTAILLGQARNNIIIKYKGIVFALSNINIINSHVNAIYINTKKKLNIKGIWHYQAYKRNYKISDGILTLSITPSGHVIVAGTKQGIFIYRNNKWRYLHNEELINQGVYNTAVSANGGKILVGTSISPFLFEKNQWHSLLDENIVSFAQVDSTSISENGKIMLVGTEHGVYLYKDSKWQALHVKRMNRNVDFYTTAISKNNRTMLFIGSIDAFLCHDFKCKDIGNKVGGLLNSASINENGKTIVVAGSSKVFLYHHGIFFSSWQAQHLQPYDANTYTTTAISADGKTILVGGDGTFLYRDGKWQSLRKELLQNSSSTTVAMSANGKVMLVGTSHRVFKYQNQQWKQIKAIPTHVIVSTLVMSDDGKVFAVGTNNDGIYVFDKGIWHHWLEKYGRMKRKD